MEDTASHFSLRIDSLCFDGIILDFSGAHDVSGLKQRWIDEVQKRIRTALGYDLIVVEKAWSPLDFAGDADDDFENEHSGSEADVDIDDGSDMDLHAGVGVKPAV